MNIAGPQNVEEAIETTKVEFVVSEPLALELHSKPWVICELYTDLQVIFL